MVQANSIGETCSNAFHIPPWSVGLLIAAVSAVIFIGGVSRLVSVTEKIVPIMALLYLAGGIGVLILRIQYIPETFYLILKYAFTPESLIGGGVGYALKTAISQGVKRGLFSNEAGMGSTPHAHAIAEVRNPHIQGTVAIIGVFIDTAVVLTITALIIISTVYTGSGPLAGATGRSYSAMLANSGLTQTNLVQYAISSVTNTVTGNIFVAVCLLFFAYSTIISWNYFGKINVSYLFGRKAVIGYSIISIACIFLGTVVKSDLVWGLQDMFNQLMVLPNVIALFALSKSVVRILENRKQN
jgi:AGCS family alanine or glycine:cation symporter